MAGGDNILKSIVSRIEAKLEERGDINADIAVIYAEAKVMGLNTKIVREVIRLRKLAPDAREERNTLLQEYGAILGLDLL